jgi:hypothetical protein
MVNRFHTQLDQLNGHLNDFSRRAGATQAIITDITGCQNDPLNVGAQVLPADSTHARLFAALNAQQPALIMLGNGEARIATLQAANPAPVQAAPAAAPPIHVPKISVPRFSGNNGIKDAPYREWRPLYDALVHNVAAIDPISKLAHLKDCLDFPAKGIGAHLPMTDAGYQARMDLLERRFANDTQELQKAIRSYTLLKSGNTSKSLRAFLDKVNDLNQTVRMYGAVYNDLPTLTHIMDAMDSNWKLRLIEAKNRRPAIPAPAAWDVDEFCRVLEEVVRIQEEADTPANVMYATAPAANELSGHSSGQAQRSGNQQHSYGRQSYGSGGYDRRSDSRYDRPSEPYQNFEAIEDTAAPAFRRYENDINKAVKRIPALRSPQRGESRGLPKVGYDKNGSPQPRKPCRFCEAQHWSKECIAYPDWRKRAERARQLGVCFRCLSKHHRAPDCPKPKPCFYCQGIHHQAFCSKEYPVGSMPRSSHRDRDPNDDGFDDLIASNEDQVHNVNTCLVGGQFNNGSQKFGKTYCPSGSAAQFCPGSEKRYSRAVMPRRGFLRSSNQSGYAVACQHKDTNRNRSRVCVARRSSSNDSRQSCTEYEPDSDCDLESTSIPGSEGYKPKLPGHDSIPWFCEDGNNSSESDYDYHEDPEDRLNRTDVPWPGKVYRPKQLPGIPSEDEYSCYSDPEEELYAQYGLQPRRPKGTSTKKHSSSSAFPQTAHDNELVRKSLADTYNGNKAPDFSSKPEKVKAVKEVKPPDIPPESKGEVELPGWEKREEKLSVTPKPSRKPEKAARSRTEPRMDMSEKDPRFTRLSDMLAVNKVSATTKSCLKESNIPGKIIVLRGMLMTIEVPIELPDQSQSSAVAFLDSGAQRSFIAAAYAKKLGLKPIRKEKVAITGFDRKTSRFDANIYKLKLASEEETIEVEIIEIDKVVGRLTRLDGSTTMDKLKQPLLPARKFSCVEPDLLLGMDEFAEIIQERVTKLASGFAMYQTKLGPIVCGR